ncbi:MAG: transketolase, partial [Leptotrichiaceae bacterium]
MEIKDMQLVAKEIRKDIIEMIYRAKSGHPGGSLSIT